jgi:CDP-6-deoxy-D-xylo-4-hexulose-3-dehydrase
MDRDQICSRLSPRTRAVFITHVLGYNALDQDLVDELWARGIPLIEDVCESYGAIYRGRKLGTFGWASNFSFYYAHHLSTIEGGMISTGDAALYEMLRMLRSHGMVREIRGKPVRSAYCERHPDLNPDFIFALPGFNVRPTELNAVLGRHQLRRLDDNNRLRARNLRLFLDNLDPALYRTDYSVEGSCNYALTLVLRRPDWELNRAVTGLLRSSGVEFRRGTAGGGNQLRQPYLDRLASKPAPTDFPQVDHIHFHGFYIGNYPDLEPGRILALCSQLNALSAVLADAA